MKLQKTYHKQMLPFSSLSLERLLAGCIADVGRSLFVLVILCLSVISAFAAEFPSYPSATLLHGQSGNRSGIYVDCDAMYQTQTISCQFFQMRLSSGATGDTLDSQLNEIYSSSADKLAEAMIEFCKVYQENGSDIDAAFANFKTQASKDYGEAMIAAMIESCDITSTAAAKELMLQVTRLTADRAAAMCKVWPHRWDEQFEYQQSQSGGYWVARNGPSGECGVVLVSTLKQDEDFGLFWNYESQKIVTNKEGDGLLLSCAELDEEKVTHSWQSVEHEVECDVFQFGL